MNITLYGYNLMEKRVREKGKKDVEYFEEDFVKCINILCSKNPVDKKYTLNGTKKVIYIDSMDYDKNRHTLFLAFKSAEYGFIRKVVNTDTLAEEPKKKKGQKDGDEETTCVIIKFDDDRDSKRAVCLIQVNSRGVSLHRVLEYLNIKIAAIHESYDNIKYQVRGTNIVSEDFLEALEKTDKIKTVKLVIDGDETEESDFKTFASFDDIRNDFEIIYKPVKSGIGIKKDTVKDFFRYYRKDKSSIKRIWIDSKEADGNPLTFDTEKMKEKTRITVSDTLSSEPNIEELKVAMIQKIFQYG